MRPTIKYLLLPALLLAAGCKHSYELPGLKQSGYPEHIGTIMLTKCAVSGCHNDKSYAAAAGLNLTTWDKMFEGSSSGAVTIPFRADFSPICYFTNTDSSLGISLIPTMPVGAAPLGRAEYIALRNWIWAGAASAGGEIKFTGDPERGKVYVANRLCDVVTVIDAAAQVQMRYVDVGKKADREFPHCIKVSPDRKHWYVSFFVQSDMVQKFDADGDKLLGEVKTGEGSWTSFTITGDSKYGYFADNSNPGKIVYASLEQMEVVASYSFHDSLQYPLGIALYEDRHKLYVGNQYGNFIYVLDIQDKQHPSVKLLPIDGSNHIQYASSLDPSELMCDELGLCYICCVASGEVRVVDMKQDKLIAAIPLGSNPAYAVKDSEHNRLFVSCPDDTATYPGNRGSVAIIDLNTYTVIKRINTGYQPYGLALDKERHAVAVVNANISSAGPDSHHSTGCGAKNGNITFIDLDALELVKGKKLEVAVYPAAAASR